MSLQSDIKNMALTLDLQLYDTNISSCNGDTIFEVFITSKKNDVDLDMCEKFSNLLSPLLEVTPPIKGQYRLEVGTPGIERNLKTIDHFKNSIGELIKATLLVGDFYQGKLLRVKSNSITLDDIKTKKEQSFLLDELQKARTYIKW